MGGEVRLAELRPQLHHGRHVHAVLLHDGEERRPVVAPVGVVVVDAGDRLDPALESSRGEDRRHHRLGLVVDAAEGVPRLRDRLLHALLGGAVPHQQQPLLLLGGRTDGEPDARGDHAGDDVDLLLQHELPEPLDGVLGVRLLLDDQLDLPPQDAAAGVDPLDRPLGPSQPRLADGRRHAGLRGEDADLHGAGLGEGGNRGEPHRGARRRGGARYLEELPACDPHNSSLSGPAPVPGLAILARPQRKGGTGVLVLRSQTYYVTHPGGRRARQVLGNPWLHCLTR